MSNQRKLRMTLTIVACMIAGTAGCVSERQTMTPEDEAALADSMLVLTDRYNAEWEAVRPESIVGFHSDDFEYYFFDTRIDELSEKMLREEWIGIPGLARITLPVASLEDRDDRAVAT